MRAAISVVIPTLNAEARLSRCLAGLVEGLEAGLIREVILADGGSCDATKAIAQSWGAEVVQSAPSRGGQLRAGCAVAKGDWLLVLHADSIVQPGWSAPVIRHLQGTQAGWFHLRFDEPGIAAKIVAGWANVRARMGLPYGDQGLLVQRALYEAVGGYPDQPIMEDVAIARALAAKLTPINAVIETSADKYRASGWFRRGARNLWTLLRYLAGASPEALAKAYYR